MQTPDQRDCLPCLEVNAYQQGNGSQTPVFVIPADGFVAPIRHEIRVVLAVACMPGFSSQENICTGALPQ
ncbi:MAG: hypothetical protein NC416_03310 [Eubacterium sp.]|nr:hypothetical protein [Eubacterium sp.]